MCAAAVAAIRGTYLFYLKCPPAEKKSAQLSESDPVGTGKITAKLSHSSGTVHCGQGFQRSRVEAWALLFALTNLALKMTTMTRHFHYSAF